MVLRKAHSLIRSPLPVVVGLCLGISVSLVLTPFWDPFWLVPSRSEQGCSGVQTGEQAAMQSGHDTSNGIDHPPVDDKHFSFDYGNEDDFTPRRIKSQNVVNKVHHKKLLRPRYISTELGIKEKLFVGVLSTRETIDSLGVGLNKTIGHQIPKLLFFSDSRNAALPSAMPVVTFPDEKTYLHPFHMLKYTADHYLQTYAYFMLLMDDTYVRAEKVLDLVSDISVTHDVFLGHPIQADGQEGMFCDFRAGIILSQGLLSRVIDNLDWCVKQAASDDITTNVGKCLFHAIGKPCSTTVQGQTFHHYSSPHLHFDEQQEDLENSEQFRRALTVKHLTQETDFYKIHKFFCELELEETSEELRKVEQGLLDIAPLLPQGNKSLTWPVGVEAPVNPQTRFDVIRWDYFDENHIYLSNDFTNIEELRGVHKLDIEDILKVSRENLASKYRDRYGDIRLLNGYRRFDPLRGMEYMLDLTMVDRDTSTDVYKRVQLLRPLSKVEIVPMPYVTESTRVNLILPVTMDTKDEVVSFLDAYAHTCLEAGDNANLFVVFIYRTTKNMDDADPFSVIKSMIAYYESKYLNGARMSWMALRGNEPSTLELVDAVSERHGPESLLFFCTIAMELSMELLNRVRMNTIQGWQVYLPIGFWQYKPNLVYKTKPYPTTIDISKNEGHFDHLTAEHVSFYNSDYIRAQKRFSSASQQMSAPDMDLFDLFLRHSDLHVFRAVEPALRLRYRERAACPPSDDELAYQRCLRVRADGLASRSQLAMLIFEHQQLMNQQHFQAVQDQNNPNVPQMKPNMLR